MKIRSRPRLGPDPQPGLQIPELFSGPHSGTFFCTFFTAFPGNAKNSVGSAGSTLFFAFPGNAANHLQKKVPEWGPEKSSGTCRPGWGFRAKFGPALIFKSGQKHQTWPEMGPESTVWPENRSRSMPGPLRSVWDGSNPLQGAVPGQKSQKVCPKTARWLSQGLALLHRTAKS